MAYTAPRKIKKTYSYLDIIGTGVVSADRSRSEKVCPAGKKKNKTRNTEPAFSLLIKILKIITFKANDEKNKMLYA